MKKFLKKIWWLVLVVVLAFCFDGILTYTAPVETSSIFLSNDYEKVAKSHENSTTYQQVFYGNSVVISAYLEEESTSDYVNFAIDYGTVEDLYKMLEKGYLSVEKDLVVGLNYFTLLDTLETNPTYPWHRKIYEPYLYFQRDRISPVITEGVRQLLKGELFIGQRHEDYERTRYYDVLPPSELDKKIATYEERYWCQGMESSLKNLEALENVAGYCKENGIRLRVVWMPWNDYCPMPSVITELMAQANSILAAKDVTVLDMTTSMEAQDFHDLGHLYYTAENQDIGAFRFTKEIDPWLKQ